MNNPALSEYYTARILVSAYEQWANPITLNAQTFTDVSFDIELLFEGQSAPDEWRLFENVVVWLRDEQFIRFERCGAHVYEYYGVTLTLKALEVMRKTPDSLSTEKTTLIDALKEALSEGKSATIQSLVNRSMSALYKGLIGNA